MNECASGRHTCHTNATCMNSYGSYTCACKSTFTGNGTHCEGTPLHFWRVYEIWLSNKGFRLFPCFTLEVQSSCQIVRISNVVLYWVFDVKGSLLQFCIDTQGPELIRAIHAALFNMEILFMIISTKMRKPQHHFMIFFWLASHLVCAARVT